MLDIRFVRENPELVKENIRKKFQDAKLPLVDEVIALDAEYRAAIGQASDLRAERNRLSKANGPLFGKLKKAAEEEKAAIQAQIDANMAAVKENDDTLKALEAKEDELQKKIQQILYIMASISGKDMTPCTTLPWIMKGGMTYVKPLSIMKSRA